MTTMTMQAAVQVETRTIYGVGATASAARADAARYTEHPDRLHVTSITDAAAEYVREHGGQPSAAISFDRNGICLTSEA
jgi:hypothetical protein